MFTPCFPRIVPSLPITPGTSKFLIRRNFPSGARSKRKLLISTIFGNFSSITVPAIVNSPSSDLQVILINFLKFTPSGFLTSVIEIPLSLARKGAFIRLTGMSTIGSRNPFKKAAVKGLRSSPSSPLNSITISLDLAQAT